MRIDAAKRLVDLDPRDPGFVQNPYAAYAEIRAKMPVFFSQQYGHWCVASHNGVSAVLREPRFGRQILHVASRAEMSWPEPDPALADFDALERYSLLELEPPAHTRLRGLVNRAFVTRRVEPLRAMIAALAHRLIDGFERAGRTDLLDPFATLIPVTVIAELIGVPVERAPDLLDWSHAMVAVYQFRRSTEIEARANAAAREFAACLRELIHQRRHMPRDDLLSALIAAESAGGRLSEDEMVATCVLLLNAGHEASVHAIGNGVKALLENKVDTAAVFAGAASAPACIEEILRFDAPLHLFTRYALADFAWNGMDFRLGDKIGLLLGAANRDPARFPQPDRFDPARTPNLHTSFGTGIHFCLGAPLARLELEVALPILFARLPGLRLAGVPRYRDTYHFRQVEELRVEW